MILEYFDDLVYFLEGWAAVRATKLILEEF